MVSSCGRIDKSKIKIDSIKALREFDKYKNILEAKNVKLEATARLLGLELKCKSLNLPDGIVLYKLNKNELDQKQPNSDSFGFAGFAGFAEAQFLDHPVEIRLSLSMPIDESQENSFFAVWNQAQKIASETFNRVVQALLLISNGTVALGPIELKWDFASLPIGRQIFITTYASGSITLRRGESERVFVAYDLVNAGKRSDRTLNRSLHRYLLSRQRTDLMDKLIDLVIAWEAILLTHRGGAIFQELSYRFCLNGASVISSINGNDSIELYKKMKCAYSVRSTIVHGGGQEELEKDLKSGGFDNLNDLCIFLDASYRSLIFKISSIPSEDRPYSAENGWEKLLWN